MSAPNFRTQRNFPLYCKDDSGMAWCEAEDFYRDMQADLDNLNSDLYFFKIEIRSGYYVGSQLYVEISDYAEEAGFNEDGATRWADSEHCRYYLDMYPSEAKRRFATEQRKVCRILEKIGATWGFEKYYCRAIFSNGEAVYEKCENTNRSRVRESALAI